MLGTFNNILGRNKNSKRSSICARCENKKHLRGFGDYCDICGCIIESKTTIKDEHCPIGKW